MSNRSIGKRLRRWGAVCGLLWAGLGLSGCQTEPPRQPFAELPSALATASGTDPVAAPATTPVPAAAPATTPVAAPGVSPVAVPAVTSSGGLEPELLRVGDSLTITFTDTPTPIPPFEEKIKEDGTIILLQNQTFTAAGLTRGDLANAIRKRYVPDYYKYMTVTVRQQESTRWYYVDGEVKQPNRQIYNSRITVLKAIASAGGFTDFANKKKVQLTHVDGRTQIVNCVKARGDDSLDPEVYPGDKIFVPRRFL